MEDLSPETARSLFSARRLWLFLDYDGTLAEFAPTPEQVFPDQDLIDILRRLSEFPERLRIVILSGRSLGQIEKLVPVRNMFLAGTYGIEYRAWDNEKKFLIDLERGRQVLDQLKSKWKNLIDGKEGFYLEDKGYTIALHAKWAEEEQASLVLEQAEAAFRQMGEMPGIRILGGSRFLEVAPIQANKAASVEFILKEFAWDGAEVIYIGDDDKDEIAFEYISTLGGTALLVSKNAPSSSASYRLESPDAVRQLLRWYAEYLESNHPRC